MPVKITLKRTKDQSLKRFHPWVFSGAIHKADGEAEEGDVVDVYSAEGEFLGRGHCQIGSIAVRILTFEQEEIDQSWWERKISSAFAMRTALGVCRQGETDCCRLVHGEGDDLPGLIVDVYGTTAVMQCHSVGMYMARRTIAEAIVKASQGGITAVYDKSSGTVPYNAGLDAVDGYLVGTHAKEKTIVRENGRKFEVDWERGQKTGFFLDQRENRELVARYAAGRKVLNTFCYTGGFSVYALSAGAIHVDSVDSSAHAVGLADRNAELNFGKDAPHCGIVADALDYMRTAGEDYDMIILDPPAFAKHHKVLGNALQGYKRLNARALSKIKKGGILFTFSCSQAVSRDQFRTTVFSAAAIAGRSVRILHQLSQPADHPVNIYHPEGEYLKGLVLYVE